MPMTEEAHLNAELRVQESLYAHARMKHDHRAAKLAAEALVAANSADLSAWQMGERKRFQTLLA